MKKLTHKFYVTAFSLIALVAVTTTADAQKRKSRSTKARTTKSKPVVKPAYTAQTEPVVTETATPVVTPPVNAQTNMPKDSLPTDTLPVMDGFFKSEMFNNAKAYNYPAIQARDARFYKRIWRDIDVNDPKNALLNVPGATLAEIVLEGLRSGKLTAYDPSPTNNDSTFATRINMLGAMSRFQDSTMVDQFDANGNKIGSKMVLNDFNPASITKFRTKEDIYFDKKRSMVVTRIIGIAPLKAIQAAGTTVGEAPVFWLYFPQCRDFFATKDVSDPDRNLYDTSLDDIFLQKRYTSTIVRESGSNTQRTTAQIASANAALAGTATDVLNAEQDKSAKSKNIESKIQNFKSKTWSYEIQKTQTAAEKKAAEKAKKDAEKAQKDAQKAESKTASAQGKKS
ncbi:gliding motility protein GldN [uncultured Mucilaginibacter sp.]|uniref:type IX secretion system ring protein PorN/GldN n=1 Tax=uncultured Mucilaginibacter sp. TaxID=797541 RepID=UPI0025F80B75|nr:gliding motility protein GldN [uncultured Mucilaginibacter sp.]